MNNSTPTLVQICVGTLKDNFEIINENDLVAANFDNNGLVIVPNPIPTKRYVWCAHDYSNCTKQLN